MNPPNTLRSSRPTGRAGSMAIRVTGPPWSLGLLSRDFCSATASLRAARRRNSRTISSTGSSGVRSGTGSPAMLRSSNSTACRPVSASGTRTVVSGGVRNSANGMSSQLTTATSAGTRRPACHSADSTPIAITSLCTKIAVRLGERSSSSRVEVAPPCGVQSPSATRSSLGSRPAARSASS